MAISACVSGPRASEVTERLNAAAGFALTQRAFALSLAKQCRFDPVAKVNRAEAAQAAMAAWTRRNQARIDAVNRYLEDYVAVLARREGRRKAADRKADLTRQYIASGGVTAQRMIEQSGGRDRCPELLERLERGELEPASPEFDRPLEELVQKYGTPRG